MQPDYEPDKIRAGQTVKFWRNVSDYPASEGWSLQYSLRGGGSVIDFPSEADGDSHKILVPAETTAGWVNGSYVGQALAVKDGEKYPVWSGSIEILPDLTAAGDGSYDARSHARKCLDAIEAVLEQRATDDILNSTIEGTMLSRIPVADLLLLRDRYKAEVERENLAAGIASGKGNKRRILVRLRNV